MRNSMLEWYIKKTLLVRFGFEDDIELGALFMNTPLEVELSTIRPFIRVTARDYLSDNLQSYLPSYAHSGVLKCLKYEFSLTLPVPDKLYQNLLDEHYSDEFPELYGWMHSLDNWPDVFDKMSFPPTASQTRYSTRSLASSQQEITKESSPPTRSRTCTAYATDSSSSSTSLPPEEKKSATSSLLPANPTPSSTSTPTVTPRRTKTSSHFCSIA